MQPRFWIFCGALLGGLGVGLGAYGAHGLRSQPEQQFGWAAQDVPRRLHAYDVAVRYQMFHAPVLLVVGVLLALRRSRLVQAGGWCTLGGVAIFCSLLYALTFAGDDWRWLGAVVPIGGLLLMVGWLLLAIAALSQPWRQKE